MMRLFPKPIVRRAAMAAVSCVALLALAGQAWAGELGVQYVVSPVGILPPWGSYTTGTAINNAGTLVGYGDVDVDVQHALQYSAGITTDINPLDTWYNTLAKAINSNGVIAGVGANDAGTRAFVYDGTSYQDLGLLTTTSGATSIDSDAAGINTAGTVVGKANFRQIIDGNFVSYHRAFIYDGTMRELGTLAGGLDSDAAAINTLGNAAGTASTASGPQHAVSFIGGAVNDLGTLPGGLQSFGTALNDAGDIVGYSDTASGTHAFVYHGGAMTDLGALLPTDTSEALGINANGQIVGLSGNNGFVYVNGTMFNLNSHLAPGSDFTVTSATGINDLGQIVAYGYDGNGVQQAVLLTPQPIPLPAALPMGAALLGALGAVRYLRRRC